MDYFVKGGGTDVFMFKVRDYKRVTDTMLRRVDHPHSMRRGERAVMVSRPVVDGDDLLEGKRVSGASPVFVVCDMDPEMLEAWWDNGYLDALYVVPSGWAELTELKDLNLIRD